MRTMVFLVCICASQLVTVPTASALSCNGKIVSEGDSAADVVVKCGEPDVKDVREERIIYSVDDDVKKIETVAIEEWTYNFGPDKLLKILTFRNGRLSDVRSEGYGISTEASIADCGERVITEGMTAGEVRVRCGEPFIKDRRTENVIESLDDGVKKKRVIVIEEWTYNFGPDRFMRLYTFRNGRLADIRLLGYGQ